MPINSKLFFILIFILSFRVFAEKIILLKEVNSSDRSQWVVEGKGEVYDLKFINTEGKIYSNSSIITSDIGKNNLFLNVKSDGGMILVMTYPRDVYSFEFSSGENPQLLSACKQITLSSEGEAQVVSLLTLCSKSDVLSDISLTDVDADKLLDSHNLSLNGKTKTVIGSDKVFIYNEKGWQNATKPYLIKGDVIDILAYKNALLKIKYKGKATDIIGWIKLEDVL